MIVPVMAISNLVLTQQIYSRDKRRACAWSWTSPFNVLKFRFRDPFISSPLRLSQFVRGLGARGVTYNFIYTCRLRKLIILTTLSDM